VKVLGKDIPFPSHPLSPSSLLHSLHPSVPYPSTFSSRSLISLPPFPFLHPLSFPSASSCPSISLRPSLTIHARPSLPLIQLRGQGSAVSYLSEYGQSPATKHIFVHFEAKITLVLIYETDSCARELKGIPVVGIN